MKAADKERARIVADLRAEADRMDKQWHEDQESYIRCMAQIEALRDAADRIEANR